MVSIVASSLRAHVQENHVQELPSQFGVIVVVSSQACALLTRGRFARQAPIMDFVTSVQEANEAYASAVSSSHGMTPTTPREGGSWTVRPAPTSCEPRSFYYFYYYYYYV